MRILFIAPYPPGAAPSQRFRFEQYFPLLKEQGHQFTLSPFWDRRAWEVLYKPGHWGAKFLGFFRGVIRRKAMLFILFKYEVVYVHREAAPVGPPLFEWMITNIFRKPLLYDFDDAIWLPTSSQTNRFVRGLKWYAKVRWICRQAVGVSCGNDYLCQYARKYNDNVVSIPSVVDMEQWHNKTHHHRKKPVVIGWTGSHTTFPYFLRVVPVLKKIARQEAVQLHLISNAAVSVPELPRLKFIPWKKRDEVADLLTFDIGIMPLPDTPWAKGKCGFKLIQYMALGIPAVADAAGVNTQIIEDKKTGFLCRTPEAWEEALNTLISQPKLREKMGRAARKTVAEKYSVTATAPAFFNFLEGWKKRGG